MKKNYLKLLVVISIMAVSIKPTFAKDIQLINDTVMWRQSSMPGYQLTLQNCSTCHSAHYAEYQPPNTGKGYWEVQVLRMKNVFKAPIPDQDVPVIVDYLVQNYGANRK